MPNYNRGDIVLFTIRYSQASQILLNTCHFVYTDDITGADDIKTFNDALLAKFDSVGDILSSIQGVIVSNASIAEARLQVVYPTRYVAQTIAPGRAGSVATASAPINSALTLSKKSVFATRWGQGSWHQPCMAQAHMLGSDKWTPLQVTNLETPLTALMCNPQKPANGFGNLHATMWNVNFPARTADVVKVIGHQTIRTQRTRTSGVGK